MPLGFSLSIVDNTFITFAVSLNHFLFVSEWLVPSTTLPSRLPEKFPISQGGTCPIHPLLLHVFMTNPLVISYYLLYRDPPIICSLSSCNESAADPFCHSLRSGSDVVVCCELVQGFASVLLSLVKILQTEICT